MVERSGARNAGADLLERAEQEIRRETAGRDTVASRHVASSEKRVQNGLLRGLSSRVEERRHVLVGHHLQGHGRRWRGEPGARDAAVARGEGEEDIAAPVAEASPHPAEAYASAHSEPVTLGRQEWRVGGEDHDYRTRSRRLGVRLVLERGRDELGAKYTS